jgi:hypothetical protein
MHRNHPQYQSPAFSRMPPGSTRGSVVRDNQDQTPNAKTKNDPVQDHLVQHHRVKNPVTCHRVHPPIEAGDNDLPVTYTTGASEHSATAAGGPVPHEEPSREADHIRSDLRPRRAQRRTRT